MHRLCNGEYGVLRPYIYSLAAPSNYTMGMRLAVWCTEEYPFEKLKERKAKDVPAVFADMSSTAVPLEICKQWKLTSAPKTENEPFATNVPVLILNGEFDPDTPAAWGADMQRRFAGSFHLVFKGMSHTPTQYWDNPCGMQVATAFFNDPSQMPQPACFSALKPVNFDVGSNQPK